MEILRAAQRRLLRPVKFSLAAALAMALVLVVGGEWVQTQSVQAATQVAESELMPGWAAALSAGAAANLNVRFDTESGQVAVVGVWPQVQGTVVFYKLPSGHANEVVPAWLAARVPEAAWMVPTVSDGAGALGAWILPPRVPEQGRVSPIGRTLDLLVGTAVTLPEHPPVYTNPRSPRRPPSYATSVAVPVPASVQIMSVDFAKPLSLPASFRALGIRSIATGPDGTVVTGALAFPFVYGTALARDIPPTEIGGVNAGAPECKYDGTDGWWNPCLSFSYWNSPTAPYGLVTLSGQEGKMTQVLVGTGSADTVYLLAPPLTQAQGTVRVGVVSRESAASANLTLRHRG